MNIQTTWQLTKKRMWDHTKVSFGYILFWFDIYIYISFWFKMKSISFIKPDHRRIYIYIYIYKECVGLSAAWKMSIINGCEGMTANGLLVVNRWTTCILETTVYKTSSWKANYIILETQVTNCKTKSEWQSRKHTILQKDMGDKLSTLIWLHEHIWYIYKQYIYICITVHQQKIYIYKKTMYIYI